MPNFTSIIKNIMRDLVVNKQLQVSFSISNEATQQWDRESECHIGPFYLKRQIVFWIGEDKKFDPAHKFYFKNEPDFLKFLNAFRQAYIYNLNNKTYSSVYSVVNSTYYKLKENGGDSNG